MYASTLPADTDTAENKPYTSNPAGTAAAAKLSPASAVAVTVESSNVTITLYSSFVIGVKLEVITLNPFCPKDWRKKLGAALMFSNAIAKYLRFKFQGAMLCTIKSSN
jgi:hypothetical protein